MTGAFQDGGAFDVEMPLPAKFTLKSPTPAEFQFVPVAGPTGATGPVGPPAGPSGQPRWAGEGPPTVVIGAHPGDWYLDTLTGDTYVLE